MRKAMVIDGNSVLNRAFYGLQGRGGMLTSPNGTPTNAIYGFLNILLKQIDDYMPDYICVAFDLKTPTFRHKMYDGYKAGRKGMPEDLAVQLPIMKDVLAAMNIAVLSVSGYEADDILGTISRICVQDNVECCIVTGDRDSLQLINEKVCVNLLTTKAGCVTTWPKDVVEKYGLNPKQLIEVKGLMGDSSDAIPGVKGVGEKTALDLIQRYGTIEGVYDALSEITQKALHAKLEQDKDMAFLSRQLGTIDCNVPGVDVLEPFERKAPHTEKLIELFTQLGFKKLIERFSREEVVNSVPGLSVTQDSSLIPETIIRKSVETNDSMIKMVDSLISKGSISVVANVEVTKGEANLKQIGFFDDTSTVYECNIDAIGIEPTIVSMKRLLETEPSQLRITGFFIKNLLAWGVKYGIRAPYVADDIAIAAYLLSPSSSEYTVEELYSAYCGKTLTETANLTCAERAYFLSDLRSCIHVELENTQTLALYENIELPLITVLAEMESDGFKINIEGLKEYGENLGKRITDLEKRIYEIAGEQFNINSPKQLGVILFEKLMLPTIKKTKTGYSTNAAVLEELRDSHEIIGHILEYRQLAKLKSTYADGLLAVVDMSTGRLHSHFQQTVTTTGRLSSTEPNLQNIPVRHEMGREIRRIFIAEEGCVLVDADYSQIELRVLAHMANDATMIRAFQENKDIHTITASQVFNVPENEVTSKLRSNAKAVNFGIVYGIGEFSLGKDLGITRAEAAKYINGYLKTYSGVKDFMTETVEDAKKVGYVTTMFGRRRMLPELTASNFMTRSFGERAAMNAPVQGSAADIIKIAMVKVYKELRNNNLKARLILQVHDELIIEAPEEEREIVEGLIAECMENAVDLKVPLVADVKSGKTWFETK